MRIRHLARVSIHHPVAVLVAAAVLTLVAASGLPRLRLNTDGRALVPAASPQVVADAEIRERFGIRDPIAVVLRTDRAGGIFNPDSLRRIVTLTEDLGRLEGVRLHDVTSLATEKSFRRESGLMDFHSLLEPVPETSEELERLRDDLARIEVYEGTLVSHDGSSAAVFLGTPPGADRARLIREIERLASASDDSSVDGATVAVIGAPVAEALLGHHILVDLGVPRGLLGKSSQTGDGLSRLPMVPTAILLMAVVFLLAFRRWAAALLPLAEIGICLAIVFGVMGWLGVPIYLTTAVLPVILAAVGVADEIHVFRRYLELGPRPDQTDAEHREVVGRTLEEMVPPVAATSITTAVAFLSFGLSPLAPVRVFGAFTAFGVLVCMVISLTVVPALLVLLGPRRWVSPGRQAVSEGDALSRLFAGLGRFASRRRLAVIVVAALVALAFLDGVRRIEVQDSWLAGFAQDSGFARATRFFDRQFLGSHRLLVTLELEPLELEGEFSAEALGRDDLRLPLPPYDPVRLEGSEVRIRQIDPPSGGKPREWTTWVETARLEGEAMRITMPSAGGSARRWLHPRPGEQLAYEIRLDPWLAPPTLRVAKDLQAFLAGHPEVGGVMGPATYLETAGFMLRPSAPDSRRLPDDPRHARTLWSAYAAVRGTERLNQLLDREGHATLLTVFLQRADFTHTAALLDEIRSYEREHLAGRGFRMSLGGDAAVSTALIDAVVSTQLRSVMFSLGMILLVASLLSRSLRWGIYAVLPPAFAVLGNLALMGWMGIPLGVATSMFAAMTLGVGVDYAIHLLARYRRVATGGKNPVSLALSTTGPAILIDALAISVGFGVLALSQVPANARLGGLLVAGLAGCLVASVLLLPALLPGTRSRTSDQKST